MEVFAAEQSIGGQIVGKGPLADFFLSPGSGPASIGALFARGISVIIGILTVVAGLWFLFQFMIGAFGWLTAGGDKAQLEGARKRLANSIIGLVIVVAAIFIIEIVGNIIGLEILRPDLFIENIWS